MVSCFRCGKDLPIKCTCKVSNRTKLKHWAHNAQREIELLLKAMDGYKPMAYFGKHLMISKEVTIIGGLLAIKFDTVVPLDWRKLRTIILLDVYGEPLYRYRLTDCGKFRKGDEITFTTRIGYGGE